MQLTLRDYQDDAVAEVSAAYRAGFRAPLMVAPTGSGKTICLSWIAQRASARGKRVLIAAHRRELVEQVSDALHQWDVPHGLIMPKCRQTYERVQVASVQTLVRRQRLDPHHRLKFDLVIVDEAHHVTRKSTWGQVLDYNDRARFLGVTATPSRLDGKGLGVAAGGYFDHMVLGPSPLYLIERGHLAPPIVFRPPESDLPNLEGIDKWGGDHAVGQLAAATDNKKITGDAISYYRKHVDRQPAIGFCVNVAHAEHVREQFAAAGYQAAVLTGKTPSKDRKAMINDMRRSQLHVLMSVNTISEGVDIPVCAAAILLRATLSYGLAMQQMGRALRTYPGKTRAYIFDHVGNTLPRNHGLPTDHVEWSLDGRKKCGGKNRAEAPNKQCEQCFAVVSVATRICPECGHEFVADKPEITVDIDTELEEIDAVAAARRRRKEQGRAESLHDLIALGRRRGYKNPAGWARHVWTARQRGAA